MRARRIPEAQESDLFEVRRGDRWWTVSIPFDDSDSPYILNEQLTSIKPDGRLDKALLATVREAAKR